MSDARSQDVYTWDQAFMEIAFTIAKRSKDPVTQVGAVIVAADNRVLSVGYNGTPRGWDDDTFSWGKTDPDPMKNKHAYVVHAERNAVLNHRGLLADMDGATVYVTHYPCPSCAQEIIQAGVRRVVYEVYKQPEHDYSKVMFDKCGVAVERYSGPAYRH